MLPVGQAVQNFGGDMQPQQQQMSNGAPQMQQQQFAAFYPQMFAQQGYSFGNNNNDNNNMQAMFYMQAGQPGMQIMQQNGGSAVNNNNQQQSLVNTLSRDNNSNNASQPSNNNQQQQMQQQQPQNSLAQQFQQIFSKQNNNNNTTGSMPTTKSENGTSATDSMQSSERDRSISSAASTHSNSQRSQYGVSNDASSTSSTTSVLQQVSQQMQQQPQQQMNSMQQQVQQQPNFANMSGSYTIPPGYTLAQAPNGQTVLVPTGPQQYQSYFQPNSNSFSQMQQQQQQQQGGPSMVSNIDPQNQNASRFFPSGFMTQNGPMDGTNSFDMTKVQLSAPASANLNAKGVSSKYRGVSWHRRDKAWTARIWNNGKSEHLGTFTTELRAALAVDIKAAAYFGDTFAEFNFPCEDERRRLIWVFMQPDIKPSSRLLEIMADPNIAVKYLAKGSSRRKNRKRLAAAMASNNSSKGDNESGSSVSSQTTGSSKVKNSKARRRDECEPHIIGLDKLRPHQHQRQAEGASDSSDSRFDSNGSNDIISKSSALRSSPSDTRKNFLRNPAQIQSGSCSSGSASSLSNEGDSGIPSSTSSGGKH